MKVKTYISILMLVLSVSLVFTNLAAAQEVNIGGQEEYHIVYTDKVTVDGVEYFWKGPENGIPKHYWLHLGDKIYALHFGGGPWKTTPDFTDKLLYIAEVRIGYFTKADQPEDPGFVHWHELVPVDANAPHDNEIGAWFRHVAVESFELTFAGNDKTWNVEPGIDFNFLPTPPEE